MSTFNILKKIFPFDYSVIGEGNDKAKEKDLHRWLTMTRLTALSMGETDMNAEHWKKVLECERAVSKRTCRACDDC